MTRAQYTRHTRSGQPASKRTKLAQATAAACLLMAAGSTYASCGTAVSTDETVARTWGSSCTFTVGSSGHLDVAGTALTINSGNEVSTSVTVNSGGRITGTADAIFVHDIGHSTNINNSGTIIGGEYAVTRFNGLTGQPVSIYNEGEMAGSIAASSLVNDTGGVVTLKTNVNRNDIRNSGNTGFATLSGTFFQESGATLRVAIASTSGETDYSYLKANSATLAGTLDVDVKANSGLSLSSGIHRFEIIRANSLSGQFEQITDNSALFNFVQSVGSGTTTSNALYIDAVRVLTVEQAARDNSNFPGVGAAQVFDSGASGLQGVIDKLAQLGTEKEVSNAVTQTLPLNNGAPAAATMDALSSVNQIVQARVEGSTGLSTGDDTASERYVWVKPFGSWANQKDRDGISGYDARTYGMTLGADGALSPKVRLGAALAYANIDINGNSSVAPQSSKVDVYQLIGYGSYSLDSQSNVNFQLDVGQSRNQGERQIPLMGVTASSDYDSLTAHAGVGLGHNYTLSDSSSFTAAVRADYSWLKDKAYGETGAGALDLQVQGRSTEALVLGVDGKLNKNYDNGTQLQASLGVGYDTMNRQASIVSAFAGAPTANFVTYGAKPSPWQVRGGLGITRKLSSGLEITGRYDVLYKTDFLNQTLSVKLRWLF